MCTKDNFNVMTLSSAATRAELEDITVHENVGTITISVRRVGDLGILSLGTLTHQSTDPEEARGD